MTTKEFISSAIEGGYLGGKPFVKYRSKSKLIVYKEPNVTPAETFTIHQVLLDPLAWQCAGYAKTDMRRMVNHLWDGGTIESYLKTL